MSAVWDVVVVGAGPAGLAAAHAAASTGARTLVLERAEHPRYKTCGGGLIGPSLRSLPAGFTPPVRDQITAATFTVRGGRELTRTASAPFVSMVSREEFDDGLRAVAEQAGATLRQRCAVRGLEEAEGSAIVALADGTTLTARTVIGADGSGGVTARFVGVTYDQVDLGLELELPATAEQRQRWSGRVLIDWGPLPGSYGWVFPKDEWLTVGVISARGDGAATKAYLSEFVSGLGLAGITPRHDSGHLTRCRSSAAPLRRGRVIVAGDAAGLLEPWTREGISYALRSGTLAGAAAARDDLDGYVTAVRSTLGPSMEAGRVLLRAFERHPGAFQRAVGSTPGWRWFMRFCRGDEDFASIVRHRTVRAALALLST
jgi:geranylgeranyl reductase family protein